MYFLISCELVIGIPEFDWRATQTVSRVLAHPRNLEYLYTFKYSTPDLLMVHSTLVAL